MNPSNSNEPAQLPSKFNSVSAFTSYRTLNQDQSQKPSKIESRTTESKCCKTWFSFASHNYSSPMVLKDTINYYNPTHFNHDRNSQQRYRFPLASKAEYSSFFDLLQTSTPIPIPIPIPWSTVLHCAAPNYLEISNSQSLISTESSLQGQNALSLPLSQAQTQAHLEAQAQTQSNGQPNEQSMRTQGHSLPKNLDTSQNESVRKSAWKFSVAGMGAGFLSSVATCPLDVVKTRLQYQAVIKSKGMVPYTGTLDTLRRIVREESVRGLYRGLKPMLLGYLPTWGIYFTTYEWMKSTLSHFEVGSNTESLNHIISAMVAGASTTTATNPIWVLKSRFMTQNEFTDYKYSTMRDAFRTILRDEGIRGLYKGLGISLVGVVHVAVQFPLYEKLKHRDFSMLYFGKRRSADGNNGKNTLFDVAFASAISKMVASSITYPHEVIRTRLQNQVKPPFNYSGIVDAAVQIARQEGIKGFYSGLSTNLIRTVPSAMITLLSFEFIIKIL